MVNVEEFAKRIKIILDYYELSATVFADKIDIQRSSISHILSGRNKPSLEFVLKILKAFPEVELYWLLNGVGKFPKEPKQITVAPTLFENDEASTPKIKPTEQLKNEILDNSTKHLADQFEENEIEKIVLFYKNGTFKQYKP